MNKHTTMTCAELAATMKTAAQLRSEDPLVILSHGQGVETAAIWKRWVEEPATRPFTNWSRLIVITSQVGEEVDLTTRLMEQYQLPEMKARGVRLVEVARRGHLESDGIVVLQDTREPVKLHPKGAYRLSDELLHSGTVPQYAGPHKCAMKFKAFVIETWMAWELHDCDDLPVVHVFGYNSAELSRVTNSETHLAIHNAERQRPLKASDRNPLLVFGFNNAELGRIVRSREYDGPDRIGHYPLLEWDWGREEALDYLWRLYGVKWVKSACNFCPFNSEAYKATPLGIERFHDHPGQTAHGLFVEYVSLCLNFNGQLYRDRTMASVVRGDPSLAGVWAAFQRQLEETPWAVYEVRRIYTADSAKVLAAAAKGQSPRAAVARCVRRVFTGTRARALADWEQRSGAIDCEILTHTETGIAQAYFDNTRDRGFPSVVGFYVACPAKPADKVRGPISVFDARYALALHAPHAESVPAGATVELPTLEPLTELDSYFGDA